MRDAMTDLKITFDFSALQGGLDRLEAVLKSPKLLEAIAETEVRQHRLRHEREVDPSGARWKALNPKYRSGKKGPRILWERGELLALATEVRDGRILIGTRVTYGNVHQFGATIKPKKAKALAFQMGGDPFFRKSVTIPARPFLGVSDEDQGPIEDVIADFAEAHLKR